MPSPSPAVSVERRAVALAWLALVAAVVSAAGLSLLGRAVDHVVPPIIVAVVGPVALVGVAIAAGALRAVAARLPADLDGWARRRRIAAALWLVLAVLGVGNLARVGVFISDPTATWASFFPPEPGLTRHECVAAYVRAGELAAGGQANLWRPADYHAFDDQPPPATRIRGLADRLDDPYEYPPPLAAGFRAAVAVTDDYQLVRAAWFGLNGLAFLIVALALAAWVGGRAGGAALLLLPALALSFPLLANLQWGQAHMLVVAASVAAMLLFARGRPVAGGVLLAGAVATKIFPGLLLVHLAVRRQWRALAATAAAGAALVAIAVAILGPATFASFVTDHLPAMASGDAFPNAQWNLDNASPYGLVFKLDRLGVAGMDQAMASRVAWIYGLAAVGLVALAARHRRDRAGEAILWLGVLAVATLRSPFAPTYSAITALWLLTLWIGDVPRRAWRTAAVVVAWICLQGPPDYFGEIGNVIASLVPQAAAIAIAVTAVLRRPGPAGTRPRPA